MRKVRVVRRDRESGRIGSTLEVRPGLGVGVGVGIWRAEEAYFKRAVGSYECVKVHCAALRAAATLMGKTKIMLKDRASGWTLRYVVHASKAYAQCLDVDCCL